MEVSVPSILGKRDEASIGRLEEVARVALGAADSVLRDPRSSFRAVGQVPRAIGWAKRQNQGGNDPMMDVVDVVVVGVVKSSQGCAQRPGTLVDFCGGLGAETLRAVHCSRWTPAAAADSPRWCCRRPVH